jgi:pyridoxine 4-dehydrogenase
VGRQPSLASTLRVCPQAGKTQMKRSLAWLLRRSPAMLPIPRTLSLGHLRENLAALEIELTDAEFDALR